jgi:hypothetical protein
MTRRRILSVVVMVSLSFASPAAQEIALRVRGKVLCRESRCYPHTDAFFAQLVSW